MREASALHALTVRPPGCGARTTHVDGNRHVRERASAVQAIHVIDTTPPDLSEPADVVLEVGHSILPIDVGQASATDALGADRRTATPPLWPAIYRDHPADVDGCR
jgi:hypothetical protein